MIIGSSAPTQALRALIKRIAASSATVMVNGESGTGKELVAQSIHHTSARSQRALVPVNCAAIPKDLLESELFGHRKGAFSGAIADRVGRFELANGGTLFLDEIGDMSLDMQAKLLRVLQEGVVDPIGATKPVKVDVRVIAATHRDLEAECEAGRFREDLYYRLNVIPVLVPPLRERSDDVPELVEHFARRHALPEARPIAMDGAFMHAMQTYHWPGNVRELSNLVNRFSALFSGQRIGCATVSPSMLPKAFAALLPAIEAMPQDAPELQQASLTALPEANDGALERALLPGFPALEDVAPNSVEEIVLIAQGHRDFPDEGVPMKAHLAEMERNLIMSALSHAGGNISRTAQLLQLQRTTLIQKMNKLRAGGGGGAEALALAARDSVDV